jgi:hypothetical protein
MLLASTSVSEHPGSGGLSMRTILTLFCAVGIAWQAHAESAVLPTLQDATLIESPDGSRANGAGPAFFAGRTGQLSPAPGDRRLG